MSGQTKPSLHEIAAMPFPHSQHAMRKFYNKDWEKPIGDGEMCKWKVTIEYSYRAEGDETFEVMATCEEEAKDLATNRFYENPPGEDAEIDNIEAKATGHD